MQPNCSKVGSPQWRSSHSSKFSTNGGKGTASCGCNIGALILTLPPSFSSTFGVDSLTSASSSKLPVHHSPGGNRLIVRAFTTPHGVPTSTVFDPPVGPKYVPCSNRQSKGPKRRLDGCRDMHHTHSHELCQGRNSAPSHISFVCCPAVDHHKPKVHAGCTRHRPSQQIMVCWQLHTRS